MRYGTGALLRQVPSGSADGYLAGVRPAADDTLICFFSDHGDHLGDRLVGYYGLPGTDAFKVMVRDPRWKYLFFANGGRELLFDLHEDLHELRNLTAGQRETAAALRAEALAACRQPGASAALAGGDFKVLPFRKWQWRGERTYQFDRSRGVAGFPRNPGDVLTPTSRP